MRRDIILEKINALPEPKRSMALREFEIDEYYARNERKHNCLIEDIPHPDMALDENGEWVV